MKKITYRKVGDETYRASDGEHTVTVMRTWRRVGGWQWEAPAVADGLKPVTGQTRAACAERALRKVAQ